MEEISNHLEKEEKAVKKEESSVNSVIVLSSSNEEEEQEQEQEKQDDNDVVLSQIDLDVIDIPSSPTYEAGIARSNSRIKVDVPREEKNSETGKTHIIDTRIEANYVEESNNLVVNYLKEEDRTGTVRILETVSTGEKNSAEQKVTEKVKIMKNNHEESDSLVLRMLLRRPRYFDTLGSSWGTCNKCGEEGHKTINCIAFKRKKPCFICGSFEHGSKKCTKGHCFYCNREGHRMKNCPEKISGVSDSSGICLKCGDSGHDMFVCMQDYSPDDLKEIQCYVCKSYGHICCVNFIDPRPREVSCYKCGKLGHSGLGCVRSREDQDKVGVCSPSSCYKCGQKGHFARECTSSAKVEKRSCELSSPRQRDRKGNKNYLGSMSEPHNPGKCGKKKKIRHTKSTAPKHHVKQNVEVAGLRKIPKTKLFQIESPN